MKFLKTLCCLLLALALCGCQSPAGETQPQTTSPAVETAPPTQTTAPPVTEPVEITLEAVNLLSGKAFASAPSVLVLDQRTAAFLTTEYRKGEDAKTVSHVLVLDLYTDTVLAEATYETALSFPGQTYCPGFLPLFDQSADTCMVVDRQLQTLCSFDCAKAGGIFTADMARYYYISGQRLWYLDTATGDAQEAEIDLTLPVDSITGYNSQENIIALGVHTQYYLTNLCLGAIDLDTGELLMLTDGADSYKFTSDGVAFKISPNSGGIADLIRSSWTGAEAARIAGALNNNDVTASLHIDGSDYLVVREYDPKQAYNYAGCTLYHFGEEYVGCQLYDLLDGMEPDKFLLLPDGNLLAVAYGRRTTKLALICPDQLTFEPVSTPEELEVTLIDTTIPESYAEQAKPVEVSEVLSEVRAQADQLQQTYDITILMSNQCADIAEACGFPLQPTDEAGLRSEAKQLQAALDDLEESLAMFPEGFFSQFRNEAHERGILVLLVENIGYDMGDNIDVLGVTYDMGDWYPIAVDITTRDLPSTYCHEIWHAIENKICDEEPTLLSDVLWYKCNPPAYTYPGSAVEGYYNDTEHTFISGGCGQDSYFVDPYGKTSPQEDRARLLEYVMTSDFYSKEMMKAPALYQKMEIMIKAIRGVFDTTGWENVRWERFHT